MPQVRVRKSKVCPICKKDEDPHNFARHMSKFHKDHEVFYKGKRLRCHICQKEIAAGTLQRHIRNVHRSDEENLPPATDASSITDPDTSLSDAGSTDGLGRWRKTVVAVDLSSETVQNSDACSVSPNAAVRSSSSPKLSTNSSTQPQTARQQYIEQFPGLVEAMRRQITQQAAEALQRKDRLSQLRREGADLEEIHRAKEVTNNRSTLDIAEYARLWTCLHDTQLLTTDEYTDQKDSGDLPEYSIVVCENQVEAATILEAGAPIRMIVVPHAAEPVLSMDKFLGCLEQYGAVDVVDFERCQDEEEIRDNGVSWQPETWQGKAAADAIRTGTRALNLLNLRSFRENAVPEAIANLPAYNILGLMGNTLTSGKQTTQVARDLGNCAEFQVVSTSRVWSERHSDHNYMLSTILVEEGIKGWLHWSQCVSEDFNLSAHLEGDLNPTEPAMVVPLRAGDLLIQPSGTLHAPYTYTDCVMSGTQHFHTPSMASHVRTAIVEYKNGGFVTNEGTTSEGPIMFATILRACLGRSTRWPWGTVDDVEAFYEAFLDYRQTFKSQIRCDCAECDISGVLRCVCLLAGVKCTSKCAHGHRTNRSVRNSSRRRSGQDGSPKCMTDPEYIARGMDLDLWQHRDG